MESLGERASDAVLLANDFSKAAGLWITYLVFKKIAPALFGPKLKPLMKSPLTAAANAFKISGLAFGVNFVVQPLLTKFNVPPDKRAEIIELFAKAVRFGIDAFIGKFTEDAAFEVVFQALRFEMFQLVVTNFVSSTQPALDTAATQFGHHAISADTRTTLATIETYDAQLSNFAAQMDGLTTTALSDKSLLRAVTGIYAETQSILSGQPLSASQFQLISGYVLNFLKSPVEAAVETAFAVASIAPLIGETLSIDPTTAVITAAMTGAEALPPPPSAGAIIVADGAIHGQPAATILPTASPSATSTSTPTATPVVLPSPVQGYVDELNKVSKLVAANDVAAYNSEVPNLLAANGNLFNYLRPLGERASAALLLLSPTAASDVQALVPQNDLTADDVGFLYFALEMWTAAPDSTSQSLASSFLADAVSAVTGAGQQSIIVSGDLKGISVPGRIVIAGDGVPGFWANFGSTLSVDYSFTNVGDQPLPAGTVALQPNTNLTLLTAATVSLPALAPGGIFLADWQFKVLGLTAPVDLGHYQIDASVTGMQPVSLDEIFAIAGVPSPTPSASATPTSTPTKTPSPTPSTAGTITATLKVTPKPTPSSKASPTPTTRPTPPPGGTTADRVLGQVDFVHNPIDNLNGSGLNTPKDVIVDHAGHLYISDTTNNRVLGWLSAAAFADGAAADLVIGQPDFRSNFVYGGATLPTANSFTGPFGLAVDSKNNLYVAARHRVLEFNAPFGACKSFPCVGGAANLVFGQNNNFTTDVCNNGTAPGDAFGIGPDSLCFALDIAVDKLDNLYVVDFSNSRVLEYNTPLNPGSGEPGAGDTIADLVFGQSSFIGTACAPGAGGLCNPEGVALDSKNNLYIADLKNHRVLEYNTPLNPGSGEPGAGDTIADLVFGQGGSFSGNSCNQGLSFPNAATLCYPEGITVDRLDNLYVTDNGNNRVLKYNTPLNSHSGEPGAGDTTADLVFGQGGNFSGAGCNEVAPPKQLVSAMSLCLPEGVAADATNNVYILDRGNNRMLEYNAPLAANPIAARLLGEADFAHNAVNNLNGGGFANPIGLALDSKGRLYVADYQNNRVLGFISLPAFINGEAASLVIGQPDFQSNTAGSPFTTGVNAKNLFNPVGVAVDASDNLYVSDFGNNRVLEYTAPFNSCKSLPCVGTGANLVFGQSSFFSAACNPTPFFSPTAQTLCLPQGLAVDRAGNLYVADYSNNRVLVYNTPLNPASGEPGAGDTTADLVFGQNGSFTSNAPQVGANGLNAPYWVAFDSKGNLYVSDQNNNRVLEYDAPFAQKSGTPGSPGDTTADLGFGQGGSFTNSICSDGKSGHPAPSANGLCSPHGIAIDSRDNLYVTDFNNNRVLKYNTPLNPKSGEPGAGDTTADLVFGQNSRFTASVCSDGQNGDPAPSAAGLCAPVAVVLDATDNLYVADFSDNRVLQYLPAIVGHPTPTATPTPPLCVGSTPAPTVPVPTPTPPPGNPVITSVTSPVLVGASFTIDGRNFTAGSMVNFFVATSNGPVNAGPLKPSAASTATQLIVPVPPTVSQGQGFVSVEVIDTDKGFTTSNLGYALLEGSAAAGLPSLTAINGHALAATSLDPGFATANVETTLPQGNRVTLTGSGFDVTNGVAVDVFCACIGGKLPTTFINPGDPNLRGGSITFTIPAAALTGPGSIVVSNAGAGHTYAAKSDAVSVPIGARINILGVSQSGTTITVTGTGFSTATVINFFNAQPAGIVNLGGLKADGAAKIPLTVLSSTKFTFTVPAGAMPSKAFVQALNPPFVPFTTTSNDPCGAFTLK